GGALRLRLMVRLGLALNCGSAASRCMVACDITYSSRLGQIAFELVEAGAPACVMAVARGLIEELLVRERHQRAAVIRLDGHSDERFALGRGAPGPGED